MVDFLNKQKLSRIPYINTILYYYFILNCFMIELIFKNLIFNFFCSINKLFKIKIYLLIL